MDPQGIARQILDGEQQELGALRLLLARVARPDTLLVQRIVMADSASYICSVSLQSLSERVNYAHQLPLFLKKLNDLGRQVVIDEETIDLLQQRPLDWSRQAPLAQYLATNKNHKFPPILAVAYRGWVDDQSASNWAQSRATSSVIDYVPLSADGRFGYIHLPADVSLYALDGQHRLMGVSGMIELIRTRTLPRRKKDGSGIVGQQITLADLEREYGVTPSDLQSRASEQIGIEIISAVNANETREESRRRVRSVFVHVNRMAVHLTPGQIAQLDEDDGFALVGRQVAVKHPFLRSEKDRSPRVNFKSSTISGNATVLTTLQAVKEISAALLRRRFSSWVPRLSGLIPLRPAEEELEAGERIVSEFFSGIEGLPTMQSLAEIPALRRFDDETNPGRGHLLFRPVGQLALADALATLDHDYAQSLTESFAKLKEWDAALGLDGINKARSIFFGLIYDPIKKRIIASDAGRDLARRAIVYMLAPSLSLKEQKTLRADIEAKRTLGDSVLDFSGANVQPGKLQLPAPIPAEKR